MFKRPLVAIDIGSSAIKVVVLTGGKHKKLQAAGLELLPVGAVVDGLLANPDVVGDVLAKLLKRLKISTRGRRAAIALGGSSVLIKKVLIEAKDKELAEQVYYEAEQQFQADMAEIYFDYCPIEELGADAGSTKTQSQPGGRGQPVLMVGAKRDMVESFLALIRSQGMRTGVVECGAFSVANMFEHGYGPIQGLTALVNVGAALTQLSLIANGKYVYTREIPIGGDEYSRRIMELLGVDRPNAETLKVAVSQGDANVPQQLHQVLGELNEQLVSELQIGIDYFLQNAEESDRGGSLNSVYLVGGGSRTLGLDAAIAAVLQIPVQIMNPFQRLEIDPKKFSTDYLIMQGHLYGVAVGLGLRSLDDQR